MRFKISRKIILLIRSLLWSILLSSAFASQLYKYQPGIKLRAKISLDKANRIQFGSNPIFQIIGDDSRYNIITDESRINLFLTSKVGLGETIELSLINVKGEVADLVLQPVKIEGQIINIDNNHYVVNKQEDKEIAQMLKNMITNNKSKYYIQEIKRFINKLTLKDLNIMQDRIYRYENLTGARLVVTNINKKDKVKLLESEFSDLFEGSIATSLNKKMLLPKERAYVWLIAKEKTND